MITKCTPAAMGSEGDEVLYWYHSKRLRRAFDLFAGARMVGTIAWQLASTYLAAAECGEKTMLFQREGCVNPYFSVIIEGSKDRLALLSQDCNCGGIVRLGDDRTFEIAPGNFWSPEWSIFAPGGKRVMSFWENAAHESVRSSPCGILAAAKGSANSAEFAHLALFGWYLLMVRKLDSECRTLCAGML